MHVDFYFDLSCPYAYLGSEEIEGICARAGATLRWRPMLLGGVFRSIGAGDGPMATLSPPKAAHNLRDATRWASRRGVPLRFPPGHPIRTVRALRVLLGLPEPTWPPVIHALYRAYWEHGHDLTRPDVIDAALAAAGVPAEARGAALAGADGEAVKDELRRRTDEAVSRGVFGAPAMFVDAGAGEPVMLWGNDRLHWVEAVLAGWRPDDGPPPGGPRPADPAAEAPPGPGVDVDFYFDLSSPFAYLGSTQIERVCAAAGARLRWRPILLGGLFKALRGPDVPMFAMPEAKRRYVAAEMTRWARWWSVPFRMSSRFPLRTVTAQRLILLAPDDARAALVHRLFRAAWVDDVAVDDDATLRGLAAEVGVDPALVDRTREPAAKQALIDATDAAAAAGVFGAPTCVIGGEVLWGQDRLDVAAAVMRGLV